MEDKIGENLGDLGFGNGFLDTTSRVLSMKEKIGELDIIKVKNFFFVKDTVKWGLRQATD